LYTSHAKKIILGGHPDFQKDEGKIELACGALEEMRSR